MADGAAIDELYAYTLGHGDLAFIHQHVVDTFTAQHATEQTKPIAVLFALVGLHLWLERGCSGREVQQAHMRLARRKESWPRFSLPAQCGAVTAAHVLAAPAGPERDSRIREWGQCVWRAYGESHAGIAAWLREHDYA